MAAFILDDVISIGVYPSILPLRQELDKAKDAKPKTFGCSESFLVLSLSALMSFTMGTDWVPRASSLLPLEQLEMAVTSQD